MSSKEYKRDWARRKRAACPEKNTLAGGRPSRAKKEKRPPGQCAKCGETFPQTEEFFVRLKKKRSDGTVWEGWAAECRPCRNLRFGPYYEKNQEKLIARAVESTKAARATEAGKLKAREWAREGKRRELADPVKRDEHNARGRKWRADNPDKAKLFKHMQKPYRAQRVMKRYARKVHATPAWADQRKIETIYAIADFLTKRTGIPYQVDHYYPIMGKTSCGLHTEANLRVIPAKANQAKGNREPTPNH